MYSGAYHPQLIYYAFLFPGYLDSAPLSFRCSGIPKPFWATAGASDD